MRARSGSRANTRAGVRASSRSPSLMLPSLTSIRRVRRAQGRLAAAGFADEADGLAFADDKAHVVDRVDLGRFSGPPEKRRRTPTTRAPPAGNNLEMRRSRWGHAASARTHGSGFQQATMGGAGFGGGSGCAQAPSCADSAPNSGTAADRSRRRSGSEPGIDASASRLVAESGVAAINSAV